ncbi:MAG: MmcQ/YjbR family DNA-binding protein [Bacteroidaceae bacterium]|nr:MmcQ/YjbR family DNA-binding protein [Bacteroidaceae bacterium]
MNIEDARLYCLSKMNATEDFPFDETTLAFRVENKIFAIVDLEDTSWFCVKCDADYAIELRDKYPQICPAWHMNKKYWNQLDITALDDSLFFKLVDHSYDEVLKKLPKKVRDKYGK